MQGVRLILYHILFPIHIPPRTATTSAMLGLHFVETGADVVRLDWIVLDWIGFKVDVESRGLSFFLPNCSSLDYSLSFPLSLSLSFRIIKLYCTCKSSSSHRHRSKCLYFKENGIIVPQLQSRFDWGTSHHLQNTALTWLGLAEDPQQAFAFPFSKIKYNVPCNEVYWYFLSDMKLFPVRGQLTNRRSFYGPFYYLDGDAR